MQVKAIREHSATVIWLHGLGGDGKEWIDMAEALHVPWAKFIMPAAQPVPLDLWQGSETSAWFDLSPGAYNVHSNSMNAMPEVIARIYRKIQPDFDKIESSAALVRELVRKVLSFLVAALTYCCFRDARQCAHGEGACIHCCQGRAQSA